MHYYTIVRYNGDKNPAVTWARNREQFRSDLALVRERGGEILDRRAFDSRAFPVVYTLLNDAVDQLQRTGELDKDGLRSRIKAAERELNGKK